MTRRLLAGLESHSLWLLVAGVLAAFLHHGRLWWRDRRRLARMTMLASESSVSGGRQPLVSILLPAWNEAGHLDACLRSLAGLRYPRKEIIVCAGGQDDTLARARAFAGPEIVILKQRPGDGKQRALRRCLAEATGKIIFLTDADCLLDDQSFERTLSPLLRDGAAAATGVWEPFDHLKANPLVRFQWASHVYRELWLEEHAPSLDGRNAAIRREALADVGGFDLDAPIGTDYVLSRQLEAGGYAIHFARDSRVPTEYPDTIAAYQRQLSRWFRNPFILGWQWGQKRLAFSMLWAGVTSVVLLLAPPVLLVARRRAGWAAWLAVVIHLWLAGGRSYWLLVTTRNLPHHATDYLRLLAYLPLGWAGLALGLKDALQKGRRKAW